MRRGVERIVWLDADAVVVDPAIDLSRINDAGIGMVRHPNYDGKGHHWNSGIIVVVNQARTRDFMEAVYGEPENNNAWMEQVAINQLAGQPKFSGLSTELAVAYNSIPGAAVANYPVVCAAHGQPHETRKRFLSQWLQDVENSGSKPCIGHRNDFAGFLNERGLTGAAAEIGILRGDFSTPFLDRWRGSLLHLIDPWRSLAGYEDIANLPDSEHEDALRETEAVLTLHRGRYRSHRMLSQEAVVSFADCSLDFVYIDGNHAFSALLEDLNAWFPKLRPGGVLAGHDYLDGYLPEGMFEVKSAIRVFERQTGLIARATGKTSCPSWYLVKPS